MNDEVLVSVLHRGRYGAKQVQALLDRELLVFTVLVDRTAFDEFHYEVRQPVRGFAAVEQTSDVRVVEFGEDLHLVAKATLNRLSTETRLDEFDRHLLAVMFVVALGEIDSAHSAAADLAQNSVWSNATACLR